MINVKRALILLPLLCLIFSSCAQLQSAIENKLSRRRIRGGETPRELAREGMIYFQDKNYKNAIKVFQKVRDLHPFSPYTILAELKIADSHYYTKKYEEALAEYEDFTKLHPRNEVIPYVIYQMGMCHFKRTLSIDRDQTDVLEALQIFERLVNTYPGSEYAAKAKERGRECHEMLAEHEFYVGKFYFKTKHYEAALGRFNDLLNKYPDSNLREEAARYAKRCELKLSDAAASQTSTPEKMTATNLEEIPLQKEIEETPRERPDTAVDSATSMEERGSITGPWENLAEHEFYVGKFYFKTKHYEEALERFEKILREYPSTRLREEVLSYINKCKERLNKPDTQVLPGSARNDS
jgi:outer membrane protein assembly factor BamD